MINNKYSDKSILLSSLKKGDTDAYEYLYTEYQPKLYIYGKRIVADDMTVQDVVQESFVKLWINRNRITISPVSYLFRSVYNGAINSIEHKKVVEKYEAHSLTDFYFNTISQLPDAESELLNKDIDEIIARAKDALPPRCREIFDLSREEGLKNSEISERLGLSVKSVETQMTIAIKRLKKSLVPMIEKTFFFIHLFKG